MLDFLTSAHGIILFMIIVGYMALGDFLTKKTKAFIPSILVFAILLGVTSWMGIIPPNIVELGGLAGAFGPVASILIVANMGTTMSMKDITSNWRIAVLGVVALAGVALGCTTVGAALWGWDTAVIATPVVGGGIVAALEMQTAALEIGNEQLATLSVLILALQSLPAFLISPPLLKKIMRSDISNQSSESIIEETTRKKEIVAAKTTIIPEKYWSSATILFGLGVIGTLSVLSNLLTKQFMGVYAISPSIFALIYSIIATELRLLPRDSSAKAGASGLIFIFVIAGAFSSIATSDLDDIIQLLVPLAGMILVGIIGIFITTSIVGKFIFKLDWRLAFALGLNCLLGFPINFLLVTEAIDAIAEDETQKEYLTSKYVPMMLVAGFVTITLGSVLLAGIMKPFLF